MPSDADAYKVRREYAYIPQDYESITIAGTAIGFTASKLTPSGSDKSRRAFCTLETAQIRYRTDGTDPTASEGHLLEVGDTLTLTDETTLSQFRAIRTGGASGVLKVTFEK